jgi:ribosome-associated protein
MVKTAYAALDDKKGHDICVIDISKISIIADYFIICDGGSESQVRALTDSVEEKMHKAGFEQKQQEGHHSSSWVLLDYGDIIVHIFDRENREFYNLERIWNDGIRIEDIDGMED